MSLGEQILRLRTQRNLSQGDLADVLGVSRQSVSKWETNTSVPDLDKLVKLSELFGVSLDELVLDRRPDPEPISQRHSDIAAGGAQLCGIRLRQVVGTALLCLAAVVVALCAVLGGLLEGLVLAFPFAVCGVICFAAKKRPGLWCAWAVYMIAELYLRMATGIRWSLVLLTFRDPTGSGLGSVHLAVAWGMVLVPLALAGCTVRSFRTLRLGPGARDRTLLLGGWLLWVALTQVERLIPSAFWQMLSGINGLMTLFQTLLDWGRLGLLVLSAVGTAALLRGRGEKA